MCVEDIGCNISVVFFETQCQYCCNTVHAVNFRRELVLENAISGSLKVLEFQHQLYSGNPVCLVMLLVTQLVFSDIKLKVEH